MKLTTKRFRLPLARPFTIARGTLTEQFSLIVHLQQDGWEGLGEVTANTYYGHSLDSIEASIEKARGQIEAFEFGSPEMLWEQLNSIIGYDQFALSALDIAAHDLFGRIQGQPCYEVWGLDASGNCQSSYTIAIDTIDTMIAKLHEQPDWPIYKIKLGHENDIETVRRLRAETDAIFRVDANCGWTADEAIEKSNTLAQLGVEFIEQPLPADAPEQDKIKVFENSALPVIADENCLVESDVARCGGLFHGINVKLCKCGGLTPAIRMLKEARRLGMKTMVGCMIESSVGISAAAQLLPLLDYADLDGAVLLSHEPAIGVAVKPTGVTYSEANGCGVHLLDQVHESVKW